jgi:hypothetical protein
MKSYFQLLRSTYDWSFRPETYFDASPAPRPPRLTDDERRFIGAIHPALMGGLYLPDLEEGEVEIARISLESVTADQISVRARPVKGGIAYAIHDEYGTDFERHPAFSRKPLTMLQVTRLIDKATDDGGLVFGYVKYNAEGGGSRPDELRTFATVTSRFYPDLGHWYDRWMNHYLDTLKEASHAEDD